MSDGYQGLSKADKWGCSIAGVIGFPLFMFLLVGDALGDCEPGPGCRHGFWLMVALPSFVITELIFWMVRDWVQRHGSDKT